MYKPNPRIICSIEIFLVPSILQPCIYSTDLDPVFQELLVFSFSSLCIFTSFHGFLFLVVGTALSLLNAFSQFHPPALLPDPLLRFIYPSLLSSIHCLSALTHPSSTHPLTHHRPTHPTHQNPKKKKECQPPPPSQNPNANTITSSPNRNGAHQYEQDMKRLARVYRKYSRMRRGGVG